MKWKDRRQSSNIDDRRSLKKIGGGLGIVGLLLGATLTYLSGGNPLAYLVSNAGNVTTSSGSKQVINNDRDEKLKNFSAVVLADTEDVWKKELKTVGVNYAEPELVLFRSRVNSACGSATSASGPFYCPADKKIYLDLSFFDDLDKKLGASGDFARAYVIAHEVGHHIQNLLQINRQSRELQRRAGPKSKNAISVIVELQADCLAGAWGKMADNSKSILESGDLEEALNAASAIGDDRLQQRHSSEVNVDSFTHGSSKQRYQAFLKGYNSANINSCLSEYKLSTASVN